MQPGRSPSTSGGHAPRVGDRRPGRGARPGGQTGARGRHPAAPTLRAHVATSSTSGVCATATDSPTSTWKTSLYRCPSNLAGIWTGSRRRYLRTRPTDGPRPGKSPQLSATSSISGARARRFSSSADIAARFMPRESERNGYIAPRCRLTCGPCRTGVLSSFHDPYGESCRTDPGRGRYGGRRRSGDRAVRSYRRCHWSRRRREVACREHRIGDRPH